jgi:hypothetical protein
MALALIMPGPNEPDNYTLEQIIEPLISELLELQQGIYSAVAHGHTKITHS